MMEAQCAVAETAIRGAEPGPAEVKDVCEELISTTGCRGSGLNR